MRSLPTGGDAAEQPSHWWVSESGFSAYGGSVHGVLAQVVHGEGVEVGAAVFNPVAYFLD